MKTNKTTLWTKNFCLVTLATILGAVGGIAGGFALSFLVFDETGSTLASALVVSIQLVPYVVLPFVLVPWMDRLPRKYFLVGGDLCNGIIYILMGIYLLHFEFSYVGYLGVSLVLACLGSVDELAYNSIFPSVISKGLEQKGYAVSSMLYPVLKVVLMPLAAVLLDVLGVAALLILQGVLSIMAALTESFLRLPQNVTENEEVSTEPETYTFKMWWNDIKEAVNYLKQERGLFSIYEYMAITNGIASGYAPILVAFFRTMPGMTAAMYSLFSVAEFLGRSVGSIVQYRMEIPKKKRFGLVLGIYQIYEIMDVCLLWLPYPCMLLNRGVCGFLGNNSAILRSAAVQGYIPEHLRSRINAFEEMLLTISCGVCSLVVGLLGEILDYRLCVTLCGIVALAACWWLIGSRNKEVRKIYEHDSFPD